MTEPLRDKQIDRLIADYLAGSLSEAALPFFERWLRASPDHPRRVARLSMTDFCIHEVCQDSKADYLLDVLNQIDDAAGPANLVTLHSFEQPAWHRYRLPMTIGGAIAAVLAIAVTLLITLQGPAADPGSIADNAPSEPSRHGPALAPTVATITATHNAKWSSTKPAGDYRRGAYLHPGTHLTLTAGFAEITTEEGAAVILEAPATVELLDNNALRLHSGKIVGICETESSKGFLVRTPHMDVIDLGTRFGVDASGSQGTAVHVMDGLVEVAQRSVIDGRVVTKRLAQDQAVVSTGSGLASIAFDAERFASALTIADNLPPISGEIARFDHPMRELIESNALQVYLEQSGLSLMQPLSIDVDGKGNRPPKRNPTGLKLSAGTRVDVYLLYLDTPGDQEHTGSYTVRFDRPILGVIGKGERLDETDQVFAPGTPGHRGGSARGAIEDLVNPDLISEDGRTLNLTLRVASTSDQLRVLVAAEEQ